MDKDTVIAALKTVKYPGFTRDIVSFGLVRGVEVTPDGRVSVSLAVTTHDDTVVKLIGETAEAAVRAAGADAPEITVEVTRPGTPRQPGPEATTKPDAPSLRGVKHVVAVASGKGGVGKSTFSVNLAATVARELAARGRPLRVGLMDCDVYGPSVPLMLGVDTRPEITEDEMIVPPEKHGVSAMSMGLLIDPDQPVLWRGPMITKTIRQFVTQVNWGELDLLLIDLPPGTGDTQLSLVQNIPLSGAIIVTTPQDAASSVARRGAMLFAKMNVPLIGVAENMSHFEAADGTRHHIFGQGGGLRTAGDLGTEFLGEVPLDQRVREGGDAGVPVCIGHPDSTAARAFRSIGLRLLQKLGL